jgi:deoxyribodipyrimidine photolyase-related protein
MQVAIIFPHHLFENSEVVQQADFIYVVEEYLFFSQYNFHKAKLTLHRAAMKAYEAQLTSQGKQVKYLEAKDALSDVRLLIPTLAKQCKYLHVFELSDYLLNRRVERLTKKHKINLIKHTSPLFLNNRDELIAFEQKSKRWHQTDFYIHERKKRNVLVDAQQKPIGGQWSFDADNRKKLPKGHQVPKLKVLKTDAFWQEALRYVATHFPNNYGEQTEQPIFPYTHAQALSFLNDFIKERLHHFGEYEDAIAVQEHFLYHSLLAPLLNMGLLTPQQVLEAILDAYAKNNTLPLNSIEGIVRQVIGWREFIRMLYVFKGNEARTKNYWQFKRKIPASFWNGTTGIEPIDVTIKKVLKTGYCQHIERLMLLGNFMLLCEFHPDEVYQWFMELFIDAYDWVMVPNVYGMSQFADGGIFATKPYISGSAYVLKMSDYKKGEWQPIWDALFWRFMHTQRKFFLSNPRLSMLVHMFDKMDESKREIHLKIAEEYLAKLDS